MADMLISVRVDVTKIDKTRLFKGEKGTYLDMTILLNNEQDGYGNNGFITQQQTKEEREKKVKGIILGNAKILAKSGGNKEGAPTDGTTVATNTNVAEIAEDLPF